MDSLRDLLCPLFLCEKRFRLSYWNKRCYLICRLKMKLERVEYMKLFRPVGLSEMEKILKDGCQGYPPRRKEQPIFYPVLNEEYAATIARDWNTKDRISGYAGFVTEFNINDEYIKNYQVQCVGSQVHQEYWIPAEELSTFNTMIEGKIQIIDAFYGKEYQGLHAVMNQDMSKLNLMEQLDFLDKLRQDNKKSYKKLF